MGLAEDIFRKKLALYRQQRLEGGKMDSFNEIFNKENKNDYIQKGEDPFKRVGNRGKRVYSGEGLFNYQRKETTANDIMNPTWGPLAKRKVKFKSPTIFSTQLLRR